MNEVKLIDCMEYMKDIPDKYFELAIVDPPYGIGMAKKHAGRLARYGDVSQADECVPDEKFFIELERISQNSIIWGGNYFSLPPTRCFLIWDKQQPVGVSFADCEMAWTSFKESAKTFRMRPQNADSDGRIHPTQKPVALYKWLLKNYAKPNDKIFDSHVGSGSSRIACYDMGFDFVGCELDADYWKAQEERFKSHTMQGDLFSGKELQGSMLDVLK